MGFPTVCGDCGNCDPSKIFIQSMDLIEVDENEKEIFVVVPIGVQCTVCYNVNWIKKED